MQVAKSVSVKVSPEVNRDKYLELREFYNTYQAIARYYSSYILERNLHKALVYDITAKDLKTILHDFYSQIRETFDVGAQTIQEVRDVVVESFNSWAKLYRQWFKGQSESDEPPSVPRVNDFTVRMNYPRVVSIFQKGGYFSFFFKVKTSNNGNGRTVIPVECGDYQKGLIENALNGNGVKLGSVQIVRRRRWFYFQVTVKKDVKVEKSETVVGADTGLRYLEVIVVLHEDGHIDNVEFVKYSRLLDKVRHYWQKIDYLKSVLPEGQRTSRQIRRLWRKIARINNWIAHNVSKRIVEVAKEHGAMISLENLRNYSPKRGKRGKKMNRKLSNWVRGRILDYTIYKANWEGIFVKLIGPKGTSYRCHICGSKGTREGPIFTCNCSHHSYTSNSDFNAACNIALRAKNPEGWGIVNMPVSQRHKAPCESKG